MYDFENKVVLITGAAKGIGAEISREVLKEGAQHVRILDIDENAGVQLQNELNNKYGVKKARFVKCDVTKDEQLFKAFENTKEEQKYLDVVINNAGITYEFDYAAIRKQTEINYIALVNGTLKAIELMDKDKNGRGGTVINMSSIAGLLPACPPAFAYSATKSAVLQFSSCIGDKSFYEKTGVRVICLCFGCTDTTIFDSMITFGARCQDELKAALAQHPMQRVEAAAEGTIEAYKKGPTASIWLISGNKPAVDITSVIQKNYEVIAKLIV